MLCYEYVSTSALECMPISLDYFSLFALLASERGLLLLERVLDWLTIRELAAARGRIIIVGFYALDRYV